MSEKIESKQTNEHYCKQAQVPCNIAICESLPIATLAFFYVRLFVSTLVHRAIRLLPSKP